MSRSKAADGISKVGPRLVTRSARAKSPQPAAISHDQIALRAYELYLEEGGGDPVGQWLRAERQLLQSATPPPSRKAAGARMKT